MKVLVFGQIGLRKKRFLPRVEALLKSKGKTVKVFHVGDMMYACDPSIGRGRILQKKISELTTLRARVFDQILAEISSSLPDVSIINSHATFRWSNGLFLGFKAAEIHRLAPDLCITLIDDVQRVRLSLTLRDQKPEHLTLKDIMVWREEEMLAAEIAASLVPDCKNYVVSMADGEDLVCKLISETSLPKAYLSYPISLVRDDEQIWETITDFRTRLRHVLICFDPYAISESSLLIEYNAIHSQSRKRTTMTVRVDNHILKLPLAQVKAITADIQGQIVARDFKLIEQSDMVVAYIPEQAGNPVLSAGVERELAHAQHSTKDTYVIWPSSKQPSPFLEPTKRFKDVDEFLSFINQPHAPNTSP